MKTCKKCGAPFEATHGNIKYCKKCRPKSYGKYIKREGLRILICPICGKSVETTSSHKIYCSDKCRKVATKRRAKEIYEQDHTISETDKPEQIKPCMSLADKTLIASSYGLTYGKLDGLLAAKGLKWTEHKKLGLKRRCR